MVALDADDDGWLDLYVANDQQPNFLWRNRGDGTFEEIALLAGCAVDADGRPQASMGVDAADFDADGDLDLVVSQPTGETHTLYRNEGARRLPRRHGRGRPRPSRRSSSPASAPPSSTPTTTAGSICWWSNGAVRKLEALVRAGDPYPLRQRNQIFRNLGAAASPT